MVDLHTHIACWVWTFKAIQLNSFCLFKEAVHWHTAVHIQMHLSGSHHFHRLQAFLKILFTATDRKVNVCCEGFGVETGDVNALGASDGLAITA